ncbi:hypothetical protein ABPG72_019990 [Tetrahymena utriculariae]
MAEDPKDGPTDQNVVGQHGPRFRLMVCQTQNLHILMEQQNRLLSEEDKWLIIIAKKYFNMCQKDISEIFNFHEGTISKIWTKYRSQNNVLNNYQNSGRKVEHNFELMAEKINEIIEAKPTISIEQMQQSLNSQKFYLSIGTLHSIMKQVDYQKKSMNQIHLLTEENKMERFDFCHHWITKNLDNIWYSNETIFSVENQKVKVWVRDSNNNKIERKQKSYFHRQIHIWAAISYREKSQIYVHYSNVNSEAYINCIKEALLPQANKCYYRRKIKLLQDGAKAHTSAQTKQYFGDQNIQVIQLPAWSPDLNPIENIWGILKRKQCKKLLQGNIETKQDITDTINLIWEEISMEIIQNTIDHLRINMEKIGFNYGKYI